jgi:uncharacterized RDD family membrane protein YckC
MTGSGPEQAPGAEVIASAGPDGDGTLGSVYADVPNRLIGYLVDAIVLTFLALVGAVVLSVLFGPVVTFDLSADPNVSVDTGLALADAVLSTAIGLVYFVGTWRRYRGSPGHRALGMRISAEDGGGSITVAQGVVRWLFIGLPLGVEATASVALEGRVDTLLLVALVAWYLVLSISTARDPRKQGIHDRVAGTVVTKSARPVPPAGPVDPGQGPRVR